MGTPKERRIKQLQQLLEGAALGAALKSLGDDANHSFVDGGKADIGLVNQQQTVLRLHNEPGRLRSSRGALRTIEQSQEFVKLRFDGGIGQRIKIGRASCRERV